MIRRFDIVRLFTFAVCLVAAARHAPAQQPAQQPARTPMHATAQALAGVALETGLFSDSGARTAWNAHARVMAAQFRALERDRLRSVRAWSARELADADHAGGTLFYPFAGPDILSAVSYFPHAQRYVLVGLEPVGPIPELHRIPTDSVAGYLAGLRTALTSLVSASFFRTNDMAVDFANTGVLPTLLASLTRAGYDVDDARLVGLSAAGAILPAGTVPGTRAVQGVQITARKDGAPVVVEYFAMDLSDMGLRAAPGARAFLGSLQGATTFVKAATYLMHKPYFSTIRTAVLRGSDYVLQDDSGIPYRFFADTTRWSVRLYGRYAGPIRMFQDWDQPALDTAYHTRGARPLPFGTGYQIAVEKSNLQLARKVATPGR